ncbi:MAG: hypothetical protein ACXAD7_07680, partial [Candidatus Kariarchaeaceae archaeon]
MSIAKTMTKKEIEIRKKFFDYWDDLETVLELDEEKSKIIDQEVRMAIIETIAVGMDDIYPETNETKKRHAFTARELNLEVNNKVGEVIKKSN